MINTRMPRLSLYRSNKSDDYRFFDRNIAEQLQAGATDLYVHKYLGPSDQGPSPDPSQPQYDALDPTNIQDLLFLENRDRAYDTDIIRVRGHYNVQNLDFDLSQFGLFLNNDILYITVHYNTMVELLGRKLIVGDVLELPHLVDYHPLNEDIPVSLRRYYQITDGNYASEGFSSTWFPHLWRIKCEPLVNSQEFSQILSAPVDTDTFLGPWVDTDPYQTGSVVTYGGTNYVAIIDVPAGIDPTDPTYWEEDVAQNLKDILSTYNNNIAVNDAIIEEATRQLPKSGYDVGGLFVVPTYGPDSDRYNEPAPGQNIVTDNSIHQVSVGTLVLMRSTDYATASPALRISAESLANLSDDPITAFLQMSLSTVEIVPTLTDTGSGSVESDYALVANSLGPITGPYGTADNTYSTSDQTPISAGFTGTVTASMDYLADCDPRFQFIARHTPRSFGYASGYMTGDGTAPNGLPTGSGITFPSNPLDGDYFLRTDYLPQILYRWSGSRWIRISDNVRTGTGSFGPDNLSQRSSFINNAGNITLSDGSVVPQKQGLSTILRLKPDNLAPK